MTARRRTLWPIAFAVAGVALLGACDGDGVDLDVDVSLPDVEAPDVDVPDVEAPDVDVPDVEAPDVDVPDVEAPDVDVPDVEAPDVEAPDVGDAAAGEDPDDGLSTEEWVLLIVLGVLVIAGIVWATSASTSHSEKKSRERSERQRRRNEIVGGCRWVIDQGALSVLRTTDAAQAADVWSGVRPQVVDVEHKIAQLSAGSGDSTLDDSLAQLGQAMAGLRSALESYVSALPDDRRDLVDGARSLADERRRQVEVALQPVMTARR